MKKLLKTPTGYFTIFGWGFCHDMGKACAIPFPNRLGIGINSAIKWLKTHNISFEIETA